MAKNCGAIHRLAELIREKNNKLEKTSNKRSFYLNANNQFVSFFIASLQIVAMFVTCILVLNGQSSVAIGVAFLQLASSIYSPMSSIITDVTTVRGTKDIVSKLASIKPAKEFKGEVPSNTLKIDLENLTIKTQAKILLNDVSYSFETGKKYVIIGESGSGKSTLLESILGRRGGYEGEIHIGNEIVSSMPEGEMDMLASYCKQEPFLFIGSLLDNITVFQKNPDMDKVHRVLSLCKLDSFAEIRGIETPLDNNQSAISLGEMQRISLARALYFDKPIILLDEVTSSLDPENAKEVMDAIKRIDDKLVIWVCHQKNIEKMDIANVVLSIQDGKLVEA